MRWHFLVYVVARLRVSNSNTIQKRNFFVHAYTQYYRTFSAPLHILISTKFVTELFADIQSFCFSSFLDIWTGCRDINQDFCMRNHITNVWLLEFFKFGYVCFYLISRTAFNNLSDISHKANQRYLSKQITLNKLI